MKNKLLITLATLAAFTDSHVNGARVIIDNPYVKIGGMLGFHGFGGIIDFDYGLMGVEVSAQYRPNVVVADYNDGNPKKIKWRDTKDAALGWKLHNSTHWRVGGAFKLYPLQNLRGFYCGAGVDGRRLKTKVSLRGLSKEQYQKNGTEGLANLKENYKETMKLIEEHGQAKEKTKFTGDAVKGANYFTAAKKALNAIKERKTPAKGTPDTATTILISRLKSHINQMEQLEDQVPLKSYKIGRLGSIQRNPLYNIAPMVMFGLNVYPTKNIFFDMRVMFTFQKASLNNDELTAKYKDDKDKDEKIQKYKSESYYHTVRDSGLRGLTGFKVGKCQITPSLNITAGWVF